MAVTIKLVDAEQTFALRQEVLRPYLTIAEVAASDVPALTFGALSEPEGDLLCCATLLVEEPPGVVPPDAWRDRQGYRLRNMATSTSHRGEGLGRAVLGAVMHHMTGAGGGVLWCNARITATGFYEQMGLVAAGPEFEVERIGVHVVMWCVVDGPAG